MTTREDDDAKLSVEQNVEEEMAFSHVLDVIGISV